MSETNKIKGYVVRGKDLALKSAAVFYVGDGDFAHADTSEERPMVLHTVATALSAQVGMENNGCGNVRIFAIAEDGTETPLRTYEEALAELERLRACPLAALVRSFRGDPASPDSRGPVWAAFDRVVAAVPEDGDMALIEAVVALGDALNERLGQMSKALDARDAMVAEGPGAATP